MPDTMLVSVEDKLKIDLALKEFMFQLRTQQIFHIPRTENKKCQTTSRRER